MRSTANCESVESGYRCPLSLRKPPRGCQQSSLPKRHTFSRSHSDMRAPQTAYNMQGTGLLPWNNSREGFAEAYMALLKRQNVGVASPNLTYVGSLVSLIASFILVAFCVCCPSFGFSPCKHPLC